MRVLMVVGSYTGLSVPDSRERAMRLTDSLRKSTGALVFAPCLDGEHGLRPNFAQIRELEREMIMRKFPDEVHFVDPNADDTQSIFALARQYHLLPSAPVRASAAA